MFNAVFHSLTVKLYVLNVSTQGIDNLLQNRAVHFPFPSAMALPGYSLYSSPGKVP